MAKQAQQTANNLANTYRLSHPYLITNLLEAMRREDYEKSE